MTTTPPPTTATTPTTSKTGFQPDRRILLGLAWRAAIVVLATIGVLVGLPAGLRASLSVLAALVTIEFFLRRYRRRSALDAALLVIGGAAVLLVVLGLVLNAIPSGLTPATWAISVGELEIIALVALAYWRAPVAERWTPPRRLPVAGAVWTVLIGGVLAGAVVWSVQSFDATNIEPVALAAVPTGDSVVVTVSSGADSGPYQLDLVIGDDRVVLATDIEVGAGAPTSITIPVPTNNRVAVQLMRPGSTDPVRELILNTIGETAVTE